MKITSWSFSRWATYDKCPRLAKYKFLDKLQEPSSPALERGTALHLLCETYLRKGGRIPKDVKLIEPYLKEFKKRKATPEAEFAFNKSWEPVSWFAKDAWCRVKADVTIDPLVDEEEPQVEIHDFKSGKLKEGESEYTLQLELYGVAGLVTKPTAAKAYTSMVFIDHGKIVPSEVYLRKDLKKIQKKWEIRVKPMLNDTTFKPKPGVACRWCAFSKSKGGPCEW